MDAVLEIKNITKTFPGVVALNDVSVGFEAGEVHAIVGENGAGKSTLIKIMSGVYSPDSGTVFIDGDQIKRFTPIEARKHGIGVIYQELMLAGHLSVAENIFIGNLPKKHIWLDRKEMIERTQAIFEELDIRIDPKTLVADLTVGFQQMVVLAKAIVDEAKILIMDEPTAPLSNVEVNMLFRQIDKLKERGVAIIYISHRLEEIFRISKRVTVLRDGKKIISMMTADTNKEELIKYMVGRTLSQVYPQRQNIVSGEIVLETKNLTGNGVKGISLAVKKGEVLGFGGLVGAGRTEFAQLLFGVGKIEQGEVFFNGKRIVIKNPRQAINMGMALVPEDRKRQGLMLGLSVKINITISNLKNLSRFIFLLPGRENDIAEKYRERFKIVTPGLGQIIKNLSGGNQQKVIVAKVLIAGPDLIIFDEPTRGIDVGAKREIYLLINELAAEGKTIIMITSEMEELLGMSDRIVVFSEGRMTGILEKSQFDAETVLSYASLVADKETSYGA